MVVTGGDCTADGAVVAGAEAGAGAAGPLPSPGRSKSSSVASAAGLDGGGGRRAMVGGADRAFSRAAGRTDRRGLTLARLLRLLGAVALGGASIGGMAGPVHLVG